MSDVRGAMPAASRRSATELLPFWLLHGGMSASLLANTAGVFIFSLLAGWLYLDSSSIWPPTLAHIANNCLAALLVS